MESNNISRTLAGSIDGQPWQSEFGICEAIKLSKIQRLTGDRLSRSWNSIPHVTHNHEADITVMEERRAENSRLNPFQRITTLAFLVKATVAGLKEFPKFNASLNAEADQLILKRYYNIGIAIDTAKGLVVGVLRECDTKSVPEIAQSIALLASKARERGLSYDEQTGGCFTISSLGSQGGTGFSPIINAPEIAIFGIAAVQERPFRGPANEIEWRKMLPMSLSYDHRVINGADAAKFTGYVGDLLGEPSLATESP